MGRSLHAKPARKAVQFLRIGTTLRFWVVGEMIDENNQFCGDNAKDPA